MDILIKDILQGIETNNNGKECDSACQFKKFSYCYLLGEQTGYSKSKEVALTLPKCKQLQKLLKVEG